MDARKLKRYLPHVLVATFAVAVVPLMLVFMLQASGHLRSAAVSVALTMVLSIGMATAGSAYWTRRSGSKDLVFGDLMIWGWIRRIRTERRLAEATTLLGLGSPPARDPPTDANRQAELLQQLASALEARDPYTHRHSRRVARHSHMIAKAMGLPGGQVAKVRAAAAVHDVGKINTPRATLNKPGGLTDEEFEVIKRHPAEGAEMVSDMNDPEISAIVRHHHERLDGTGYPDRLAGAEIPLGARIIAVADSFDAITSSRPYRPAAKHRKGIEILRSEAGFQLDRHAVRAFLSYYTGRRSIASWAFLSAIPERLLGWLGGAFQSAGAAPIANSVSAVGAAVVIGGSLAGSAAVGERPPDGRTSGPVSKAAVDVAGGVRSASPRNGGQASGHEPGAGHSSASGSGHRPRASGPRRLNARASGAERSGSRPYVVSTVLGTGPSSSEPSRTASVGDGSWADETSGAGPGHKKSKKKSGPGREKKNKKDKKKSGSGADKKDKKKSGSGAEKKGETKDKRKPSAPGKSGSGHEKAGSPGKSGSSGGGNSESASGHRSAAAGAVSSALAPEAGNSAFAPGPEGSAFAPESWAPDFAPEARSSDPALGLEGSAFAPESWAPDFAPETWSSALAPGPEDPALAPAPEDPALAPSAADPGFDPDLADPGAPGPSPDYP